MSAPAIIQGHYSLHEVVRAIEQKADEAASAAAEQAREEAEKRFMTELRRRYAGQTLFCYDEAWQTNRFATEPPRQWNAVASSFEECIANVGPHFLRYRGEDRRSAIERRLKDYQDAGQLPSLDPEQTIVFECGGYWYCFFCVRGEDYCDKVEAYLASERKRNAEEVCRPCRGCIEVD